MTKKKINVDVLDHEKHNILYFPIKNSYDQIFEYIVKHIKFGVQLLELHDYFGNTPLHYSIIFN